MKAPKIKICPIKQLYRLLAEQSMGNCAAIISSSSPINTAKVETIRYRFRQYDDLDYPCPGRSFSIEDAQAFAAFLKEQLGKIDTLFCCCDAGESRSPAVAAAVMRYLDMNDMLIWTDLHYHPNMLVYDLLTQALGVPTSDEDKDIRIHENRKVFQNAISKARSQNHRQTSSDTWETPPELTLDRIFFTELYGEE